MPTLPDTAQSTSLLLISPNVPDKIPTCFSACIKFGILHKFLQN